MVFPSERRWPDDSDRCFEKYIRPVLEQGQGGTQRPRDEKHPVKMRTQLRHRCGPGGMQWVGVNQPMEIQKKVAWAQLVAHGGWRWCVAFRKLKHYLMWRILEKRQSSTCSHSVPVDPSCVRTLVICSAKNKPVVKNKNIFSYFYIYVF